MAVGGTGTSSVRYALVQNQRQPGQQAFAVSRITNPGSTLRNLTNRTATFGYSSTQLPWTLTGKPRPVMQCTCAPLQPPFETKSVACCKRGGQNWGAIHQHNKSGTGLSEPMCPLVALVGAPVLSHLAPTRISSCRLYLRG